MYKYIFCFYFVLCSVVLYSLDTLPSEKKSSFEGRHFFVGFMQNEIEFDYTPKVFQIFITSNYETTIRITQPGISSTDYKIAADSVLVVSISTTLEAILSEEIEEKIVEINSDKPISVYAFNSRNMSSDSYSVIPTSYWGQEYVVLSYPNDMYDQISGGQYWNYPRHSEFMIMSGFDSTEITIIPSVVTFKNRQIGQEFTITLKKGESYLVKSNLNYSIGQGDLTGTIVRSTKPIGLIAGNVRTAIPQYNGYPNNSKDHLVEMLTPTISWGRKFESVPFKVNDRGDVIRITCIEPNTVVTMHSENRYETFNLNTSGAFVEVERVNEPTEWHANFPIQIGQFMAHTYDIYDSPNYDPCMVILSPVEQFVSRTLFQTPGNDFLVEDQFIDHYAILIYNQEAFYDIKLDGTLLVDISGLTFQTFYTNDKLYWTRINLEQGKHEFSTQKGGFTGILYGIGSRDSYGMILGSSLTNPYFIDSLSPEININGDCGFINGTITEKIDSVNSGIDYVEVLLDSTYNFSWNISPITDTTTFVTLSAQVIDSSKDANFVVDIRDKNGNGIRYRYHYYGIKLHVPDGVLFDEIMIKDSICQEFYFVNGGNDTLTIDSTYLSGNKYLSYSLDKKLPIKLLPGTSVKCQICYHYNTDTASVISQLTIQVDCGIVYTIPIKTKHYIPEIKTIGYDFGTLLLGKDSCDYIYIINMGNTPIRIDSLIITEDIDNFSLDTVGLFPKELMAGDTLKIRTCFKPLKRGNFRIVIDAKNQYNIENEIIVEGKSVAPSVSNIYIDWMHRRVETTNDTIFYLYNTGNCPAKVTFDSFEYTSIAFDSNQFKNIDIVIPANDSIALDFAFIPLDTIDYSLKAKLKVDWEEHDKITIELHGFGTIPVIDTINIDMDTIFVFSSKFDNYPMIKSTGNEQLTVDSIISFSGDINSFNIDYSQLKNLIIQTGHQYQISIEFKPQFVGKHTLLLEATNDAAPNYKRIKTFLKIVAYAKPLDTIVIDTWIDEPSKLACIKDTINVYYKNTGNIDFVLKQYPKISVNNISYRIITEYDYPVSFLCDSILKYQIEILAMKSDKELMTVEAEFTNTKTNKDTTIMNTVMIEPESTPLFIGNINELISNIGDTISFAMNGEFPYSVDTTINLSILIKIPQQSYYLLDDEYKIKLQDKNSTNYIELEIVQSLNEILIKSKEPFKLKEKSTWSIDLHFLTLLNIEQESIIEVFVNSDDCFDDTNTKFLAKVNEICVRGIRYVKQFDIRQPELRILSNVIKDKLYTEIELYRDDKITLYIYDRSGKKFSLIQNLFLKKGNYSFIFENIDLPSGIYFLSCDNKIITINKIFIISK